MNHEELKYYEALQEKFREKMGEKQEGDRICCKAFEMRTYQYTLKSLAHQRGVEVSG